MMYVDEPVVWCLECDSEIRPSPENIYGYGIVECALCGNWIAARKTSDLLPGGSRHRSSFCLFGERFLQALKRAYLTLIGTLHPMIEMRRNFSEEVLATRGGYSGTES
jgi:hypothetical protein